jgi:hypothetical protein
LHAVQKAVERGVVDAVNVAFFFRRKREIQLQPLRSGVDL